MKKDHTAGVGVLLGTMFLECDNSVYWGEFWLIFHWSGQIYWSKIWFWLYVLWVAQLRTLKLKQFCRDLPLLLLDGKWVSYLFLVNSRPLQLKIASRTENWNTFVNSQRLHEQTLLPKFMWWSKFYSGITDLSGCSQIELNCINEHDRSESLKFIDGWRLLSWSSSWTLTVGEEWNGQ